MPKSKIDIKKQKPESIKKPGKTSMKRASMKAKSVPKAPKASGKSGASKLPKPPKVSQPKAVKDPLRKKRS